LSISIPADTEADCSVGTWVPLRRSRLARALTNPLSCIHPSLVLAIESLLQPRLLASCSRLLSACAAAHLTNPLLSPAATGNPLSSSSSSLQPLPGQLLLVLPFGRLPACSLPPHIGPCSPRPLPSFFTCCLRPCSFHARGLGLGAIPSWHHGSLGQKGRASLLPLICSPSCCGRPRLSGPEGTEAPPARFEAKASRLAMVAMGARLALYRSVRRLGRLVPGAPRSLG
jgi:hypothetical protein